MSALSNAIRALKPGPLWRGASRERRVCGIFAIACLAWCYYTPANMRSLFLAIPNDAEVAAYTRDVAGEWKALTNHRQLIPMLEALGVEDAADLKEEEGLYQTLFWLTGRHSVFGLNTNGQSSDISTWKVYGASAVGWKQPFMRLMWAIKYVPGLGKLDVTPSGTRYMVFRHSRTMRRMGLVLSLDVVDGNLLGVLSADPDAVRRLTARAARRVPQSAIFHGTDPASNRVVNPSETIDSRNSPVQIWVSAISARELMPHLQNPNLIVRCASFRNSSSMRISVSASPRFRSIIANCAPEDLRGLPPPKRDARAEAQSESEVASIEVSDAVLKNILIADEPANEFLRLSDHESVELAMYGKPNPGRLLGLAVPHVIARIDSPRRDDALRIFNGIPGSLDPLGAKFTQRGGAGNPARVLSVSNKIADSMWAAEDRPFMVFDDSGKNGGASVVLGTCLSAYLREARIAGSRKGGQSAQDGGEGQPRTSSGVVRAGTGERGDRKSQDGRLSGSAGATTAPRQPATLATARINAPKLADAFSDTLAVARMAASFGLIDAQASAAIGEIAAHARRIAPALKQLGDVRASLDADIANGRATLVLSAAK